MGTAQQLEQLEANMDDAKRVVLVNQAFQNLSKNRDFKLLIQEEYLEQEAIRLVQAKSNPGLQNEVQQKFIENSILGIGALQQFFNKLAIMSAEAERALEADQDTHAELSAQDD